MCEGFIVFQNLPAINAIHCLAYKHELALITMQNYCQCMFMLNPLTVV